MKKFIRNISRDFVYPNEVRSEYGGLIDHNINNNAPTGEITVSNISGTTSTLNFTVDYTYNRNSSEPFQTITGSTYTHMTMHLMGPSQEYLKPFILIDQQTNTSANPNLVITGVTNISLVPGDLGLTEFTTGEYILDARFIGKRTVSSVETNFEMFLPYTGSCIAVTDVYKESTAEVACSELIKTGNILRSDDGTIDTATVLFGGLTCGYEYLADAAWYHESGSTISRYWNGTTFTEDYTCVPTPTPTPTPTPPSTGEGYKLYIPNADITSGGEDLYIQRQLPGGSLEYIIWSGATWEYDDAGSPNAYVYMCSTYSGFTSDYRYGLTGTTGPISGITVTDLGSGFTDDADVINNYFYTTSVGQNCTNPIGFTTYYAANSYGLACYTADYITGFYPTSALTGTKLNDGTTSSIGFSKTPYAANPTWASAISSVGLIYNVNLCP